MGSYFLKRLALIPPTLLGVTLIVFAITRLVPGGPLERAIMEAQVAGADAMSFSSSAGQNMAISDEQLEQLKAYYGFDKPILESYVIWVGKILTGDLGTSYRYNEPVWNVIKDRFPISIYYAKCYYELNRSPLLEGQDQQAFVFEGKEPCFSDFIYVSYSIGLTYSMTDCSIEDSFLRRIVSEFQQKLAL